MHYDTVYIRFKAVKGKRWALHMKKALVKFMMLANKGGYVDVYFGDQETVERCEKLEHCGAIGLDPVVISVGLDESTVGMLEETVSTWPFLSTPVSTESLKTPSWLGCG